MKNRENQPQIISAVLSTITLSRSLKVGRLFFFNKLNDLATPLISVAVGVRGVLGGASPPTSTLPPAAAGPLVALLLLFAPYGSMLRNGRGGGG